MLGRALFLTGLLASACGSGRSVPDGGDPDGGVPQASDYCEATAGFFCDFYLRCGRIVAATPEACRAVFIETCNARYEPRYRDLVGAGLLSLSPEGIAACAAHLSTVDCAVQSLDLDGPCATMWRGMQPAGGPCSIDVESFVCAPGSTCTLGLDLCGTCEPSAPTGGDCSGTLGCASSDYCDGAVCRARPHAGQACSTDVPCALGARCMNARCEGLAYVGVGERCDSTHRCAYRSRCVAGQCVEEALLGQACGQGCTSGRCVDGICAPLAGPGEACTDPSDCSSGICGNDDRCASLPSVCFQK